MKIVVMGGTGLIGKMAQEALVQVSPIAYWSLTPGATARSMPTHFEPWLAQSPAAPR